MVSRAVSFFVDISRNPHGGLKMACMQLARLPGIAIMPCLSHRGNFYCRGVGRFFVTAFRTRRESAAVMRACVCMFDVCIQSKCTFVHS